MMSKLLYTMNEPQELIDCHIKLYQKHYDFLDSIDGNNQSNAMRKALDILIDMKLSTFLKDHMELVGIGVLFIFFSLFITNPYLMVASIAFGVLFICYSVTTLALWKMKK